MNRLAVLILSFFLVNNCSFNENSGIWKDKQKALEDQKNIEKVFLDKELVTSEFNQELEIDLANIKTNNKIIDNKNNFGSQNYEGLFNKVGNYKFSKLENVVHIVRSFDMPTSLDLLIISLILACNGS